MIRHLLFPGIVFVLTGCSRAEEQPVKQTMSEAELLYRRGSDLVESDPKQAIELLTKSLELVPNFTAPLYNRILALANVGRDDEAVADMARLDKLEPPSGRRIREYLKTLAGGYTSIAEGELQEGNYEAAIRKCNSALSYNPEWSDAWIVKALTYHRLGDVTKALLCYDQAVLVDRSNYFIYINRAELHRKENRLPQALKDFTKSIELKPLSFDAYEGRAAVYSALQMPEKAEADRAKSREIKKAFDEKKGA